MTEPGGRYGGRFVIGQTNSPRTFNAMTENRSSSRGCDGSTSSALLAFNTSTRKPSGTGQVVAGVGRRHDVTFHLRKGAAFSDGHPITSQDVLFSFQLALDPCSTGFQDLLKIGDKFYDVSAPDAATFVVKTPVPSAIALHTIAAVPIMPKHVLEGPFKAGQLASAYNVSTPPDKLVSSGPFRVVQFVPGEKTVLGRNPYLYEVDPQNRRLPYLDEVIFVAVPDQDAADLKFRSGELHGLDNVKPENYRWYQDNQQQGNFTLHDLGPT
jgi:peptide/nickel transport system substrate-binding protein